MLSTTVHTTGINWESLTTTLGSITLILGVFGRMVSHSITRSNRDDIRDVVAKEVTPQFEALRRTIASHAETLGEHGRSIAHLNGIEEGKRQARLDSERKERER